MLSILVSFSNLTLFHSTKAVATGNVMIRMHVINMKSHGFLCDLGKIALAVGKIVLASLVKLPCLLLIQLFQVVTHTNHRHHR